MMGTLSLWIGYVFSGTAYTWNHTVGSLWWLVQRPVPCTAYIISLALLLWHSGAPLDRWGTTRFHSLLKDIWVLSSWELLQIKLLRAFGDNSLGRHVLPLLLGTYLGMEPLGHMLTLCSTLQQTDTLISRQFVPLCIPPAIHDHCFSFISSPTLVITHHFSFSQSSGWVMVFYPFNRPCCMCLWSFMCILLWSVC